MIRSIFIKKVLPLLILPAMISCTQVEQNQLMLWYNEPASQWTEALPVGNGRMAAMVFGGVEKEHIQFNEETLWSGKPNDYSHKGAFRYLDEIRQLLFDGKQDQAEELAMKEFMSNPLRQMQYQAFGDLYLEFPGHKNYTHFHRELDISRAVCKTSYQVDGVHYIREIIASNPQQVIAMHIKADKADILSFRLYLDSEHEEKSVTSENNIQTLNVAVKDGALKGVARIKVETDGEVSSDNGKIIVSGAGEATIWLSAATNFNNYMDISGDPLEGVMSDISRVDGLSYDEVKAAHVIDYQSLFKRFELDFGSNGRDTLTTDMRILKFSESPVDPQLLALYTQYGRYLLISSSRSGTQPANLQGIWNKDLKPAWGSKYTTNINTEMNYWAAEVSNLPECHEPLFSLLKDCSETGAIVAKEHYNCDGWVLHHNTEIWRGTAPINNSNHGMWVAGSGWLSLHLWEHYLFTRDEEFLRDRAYPLMKGAALFYSQYLIKDPETGWLISTPSNSPENGGLVAGPTMDHQIIRSLYYACIEASDILNIDKDFAALLKGQAAQIAPNQIGQYGQLQEWLEDIDNPENKAKLFMVLWYISLLMLIVGVGIFIFKVF